MSWDLNGTDQYARFTMSANLKAATGGPFTFGAVVNLTATTDGALIHMLDGTTGRHFLEIFGTYNWGTSAAVKSGPAGVGGGTTWVHIIMSKPTGTVPVEYTIFDLTAATAPTSGTASGGNLANGAAPGASGQIQIGRFATSATEYVSGKVAALWCHGSYLNQAAREALTTWTLTVSAASASSLGWAVRLNSLSTIVDATGLGGDETGRFGTTPFTLGADPSGSFFDGGDVAGTASANLGGLTSTASGTRTVTGTAAASLGALAGTAAGTRTVTGTAAATLGALSAAATGTRTVTGTAAAVLGGLGATAAGQRTVFGTAAANLGALAAAAGAVTVVSGTASANLGALTAAASPGPVGLRGEAHGALAVVAGAITVHTGSIAGAVT